MQCCGWSFVIAVKYEVAVGDGIVVAKTPEEGVEFYVKDGNADWWHFYGVYMVLSVFSW